MQQEGHIHLQVYSKYLDTSICFCICVGVNFKISLNFASSIKLCTIDIFMY